MVLAHSPREFLQWSLIKRRITDNWLAKRAVRTYLPREKIIAGMRDKKRKGEKKTNRRMYTYTVHVAVSFGEAFRNKQRERLPAFVSFNSRSLYRAKYSLSVDDKMEVKVRSW